MRPCLYQREKIDESQTTSSIAEGISKLPSKPRVDLYKVLSTVQWTCDKELASSLKKRVDHRTHLAEAASAVAVIIGVLFP